ncbi:hypothetical protein HO404_00725 [Streptococcus suis]|uniref:hypothetical protein n=1 Tax=Streptococcus suis TaxID=1307 RepID=UPI000CF5C3DC|nr:hypothetical protein [Streptococcus suis]NQH34529.1 hypothetical protein [Streptococcus suis]NQH97264.1 hypothetical protein [Streptococcus suis]NQM54363.1 hypothetical protein [Streptococcus suis]NQO47190.1 hypothetical protein [Streptococcus suis]WNF84500.1 hypothetical protein RJW52_00820 [Streptococcus suis]
MKTILVFMRSFMVGFMAVAILIMLVSSLFFGRELDVVLLFIQLGALKLLLDEEKKEKEATEGNYC